MLHTKVREIYPILNGGFVLMLLTKVRETCPYFEYTNTLTHTRDGPDVASRSSGSRGVFFGLCNIFCPTSGQQEFFGPPGGHTTYENIILRELIVSFVYVSIFTQALCCKVYV